MQATVPRMVHRDEVIADEARGAVRAVLAADAAGDGALSRDAVQLVADLVKRRKCVAPPQTVEVLLGLALRSARASDVKSGGAPQALLPRKDKSTPVFGFSGL